MTVDCNLHHSNKMTDPPDSYASLDPTFPEIPASPLYRHHFRSADQPRQPEPNLRMTKNAFFSRMKVINCWNPKHRSPRPWCESLGHMLNRFPQANTVRGCEEKEIYIYSYQSASPLSDWLLTWSQQGWNRGGHVDLVYVSCQAGACLISTALRNKDWVTAVFPPLVMTKIGVRDFTIRRAEISDD